MEVHENYVNAFFEKNPPFGASGSTLDPVQQFFKKFLHNERGQEVSQIYHVDGFSVKNSLGQLYHFKLKNDMPL